jgi:hypothetical protein
MTVFFKNERYNFKSFGTELKKHLRQKHGLCNKEQAAKHTDIIEKIL